MMRRGTTRVALGLLAIVLVGGSARARSEPTSESGDPQARAAASLHATASALDRSALRVQRLLGTARRQHDAGMAVCLSTALDQIDSARRDLGDRLVELDRALAARQGSAARHHLAVARAHARRGRDAIV